MNIPANERHTLAMSVFEAHDMTEAGEVLDGWCCFLGGLARAEVARDFGEPWAEELEAAYREALDRYGEPFGIRPE